MLFRKRQVDAYREYDFIIVGVFVVIKKNRSIFILMPNEAAATELAKYKKRRFWIVTFMLNNVKNEKLIQYLFSFQLLLIVLM